MKVKYYPALVQIPSRDIPDFRCTFGKYKNLEDAKRERSPGTIIIRLITEVPELIEEKEE